MVSIKGLAANLFSGDTLTLRYDNIDIGIVTGTTVVFRAAACHRVP